MAHLWLLSLLIEAIIFIAIEHHDRKKTHKILRFVSGDKPDIIKEVMAMKSWAEKIREQLKIVLLVALWIFTVWFLWQLK